MKRRKKEGRKQEERERCVYILTFVLLYVISYHIALPNPPTHPTLFNHSRQQYSPAVSFDSQHNSCSHSPTCPLQLFLPPTYPLQPPIDSLMRANSFSHPPTYPRQFILLPTNYSHNSSLHSDSTCLIHPPALPLPKGQPPTLLYSKGKPNSSLRNCVRNSPVGSCLCTTGLIISICSAYTCMGGWVVE